MKVVEMNFRGNKTIERKYEKEKIQPENNIMYGKQHKI